MSEKFYDYNGIIAEYWDLLRGDTSKWSSRPYFLQLIRDSGQLLREAGFVEVQAHADFRFEPAAEDETNFIVLGKRPFSAPV